MSGRSALAVVAERRALNIGGRTLGPGTVFVGDPDTVAGLIERGICRPLEQPDKPDKPDEDG